MTRRRTALFVSRLPPSRRTSGGGGANAYSAAVLEHLASRGFSVSVLHLEPLRIQGNHPSCEATLPGTRFEMLCPGYMRCGGRLWSMKGVIGSGLRKARKLLGVAHDSASVASPGWGEPVTEAERTWIRSVAADRPWDVVIANYCWMADAFADFSPATLKMILTHDVWHHHALRPVGSAALRPLDRDEESRSLRLADVVVAITAKDAETFRQMVPGARVVTAPMSCPLTTTATLPEPGRLLFVGSSYKPNVEGLDWFRHNVGRALQRHKPNHFTLRIAGSVCGVLEPCDLPNALAEKHLGFVDDLSEEYAKAEVVVVPVLTGTGMKIKLVDAIGHGKAIVTTSEGASGLLDHAGSVFCVADDPDGFASAIVAIADDSSRRQALEAAARRAATSVFSDEHCFAELDHALDTLLAARLPDTASAGCN